MMAGLYLWRGQYFSSQAAVADAAGVSRRTVAYHLDRYGHVEFVGQWKHGGNKSNVRPVSVLGIEFESQQALADFCNVTRQSACLWVRRGMVSHMEQRVRQAMKARAA